MSTSPSKRSNGVQPTGDRFPRRHVLWALLCVLWGASMSVQAQVPCEDGMAGQYPCLGLDLMCVRSFEETGGIAPGNGNDCWGWTSDGREFVLFGRSDGTSIIEVTDPVNPIVVADVPTATTPSLWRDIKVIGDVAYIVSEAGDHGLQIIDLSIVPDLVPGGALANTAYYTGFGNAHNVVANPETGYVYGVGTNTFSGGLHIVDVNDPLNPTLVGSWDENYIHDAQAVVYDGPDADHAGKEVVFAFCGYGGFRIIDVEDKADCQTLGGIQDSMWVYIHQGWLSEDHRYVFLNDEIDEISGVTEVTRTWILDVQDLDDPVVVGYHEGNLSVTDHNLYTHNGKVYEANYYAGLQVLDIVDPATATLSLSAYFDTNPFSDQTGTSGGAWNVYPFFESGNIAISTQSHFFMVRPSSLSEVIEPLQEVALTLGMEAGSVRIQSGLSERAWVFDAMGRIQAEWPLVAGGWSTYLTPDWPAGTYVLRTESGRMARFIRD